MKLKEVNCPLCGSHDRKVLFKRNFNQEISIDEFKCTSEDLGLYNNIYKCNSCGLIYQSPILDKKNIIDVYKQVEDNKYLKKESERTLTFKPYISLLDQYLKKYDKILEIGCYTGIFLNLAYKHGFKNIQGLELSHWAREIALKKNDKIFIYNEELQNFAQKKKEYNAICLWDVIEHYSDPVEELIFMNKLLKKDGLLFFSTINTGSIAFRLLGKKYPFLMVMHLVYFSKKTLRTALEKAGFELILFRKHKRIVTKKYLFWRFNILFKNFSFIFKGIFSIYFILFKKDFISIDFMGLVDVIAKKFQ